LDAFRLEEVTRSSGLIRVRLREPDSEQRHLVELTRESLTTGYLTCSAEAEHEVPQFRLRSYRLDLK
jgi:hypothetical protein